MMMCVDELVPAWLSSCFSRLTYNPGLSEWTQYLFTLASAVDIDGLLDHWASFAILVDWAVYQAVAILGFQRELHSELGNVGALLRQYAAPERTPFFTPFGAGCQAGVPGCSKLRDRRSAG